MKLLTIFLAIALPLSTHAQTRSVTINPATNVLQVPSASDFRTANSLADSTALNATNLTSGTVPALRLPANLQSFNALSGSGFPAFLAGTSVLRTITVSGSGISISGGNGSSDPLFTLHSNLQLLATTSGPLPSFFSLNSAALLPKWRAARARVMSGTGSARIVCLGDSTTSGYGAAGGSGYTGAKANSYPRRLSATLSAIGIPGQESSAMGANQILVSAAAYDPRITLGSGWAVSSFATVGMRGFQCASTNGAILSFAPAETCDTADIYYSNSNLNGGFTINVDGGSTLATVTPAAVSATIAKQTVTFSAGVHTLNVVTNSTTFAYVAGIVMYSTAGHKVDVVNAGYDASKVADLDGASDYFSPRPAAVDLAPDLYILNIGINDMNSGTSVGSFTASLNSVVSSLKAVADVIVVVPQPCSTVFTNQAQFQAAMYNQAASSFSPALDLYTRWVSYSSANGVGLIYDTLHPSQIGYQDVASYIAFLLSQ